MKLFPGQLLSHCWQQEIAPLYQGGMISGKEDLIAAIYHFIRSEVDYGYWPWLSPELHFSKRDQPLHIWLEDYMVQNKVGHYKPDILISCEGEIIAALMIAFSPTDYLDYRKSMEFLSAISRLAGRAYLHLNILPDKGGKDPSTLYLISEEIRLVYAVIGKKGAFALDTAAIKKEFPLLYAPTYFLHLTASIQDQKVTFNAKD
ncbi:MAG: hypothetical protein AAF824_22915 [Bacteroidota bacterium]